MTARPRIFDPETALRICQDPSGKVITRGVGENVTARSVRDDELAAGAYAVDVGQRQARLHEVTLGVEAHRATGVEVADAHAPLAVQYLQRLPACPVQGVCHHAVRAPH